MARYVKRALGCDGFAGGLGAGSGSGGVAVLVDESTEDVDPFDPVGSQIRFRYAAWECSAWEYSLINPARIVRRWIREAPNSTTFGGGFSGCWLSERCGRFSEGPPELEAEISVFALLKG
jgi:hypothetical protein